MTDKKLPAGGEWLVEDVSAKDAFFPENYDEDFLTMAKRMAEFGEVEIAANAAKMDSHDHTVLVQALKTCGELGYLGIDVPEEFGGLGLGLKASVLAFEKMCAAGSGSFAVSYGAHTGIGTVPILLYGNDEQKARFLPDIASGARFAAYALTESGSGSDALAAKTTAVLSPDGSHYVVNGSKLFITNAGFADIFTVFVKIDGKNCCLVVERGTPGFSVDKEEEKVGIRGSSTCALTFENALVPASNLLGEIGKGHKIVLNTLNIGRLKLAAGNCGLAKRMVTTSVQFAMQRSQFGKPLSDFDAIRTKLADMAADAWVGEAMAYRTAGLVAERLEAEGAATLEEHSLECALVKVALSESSHRAVDEAVQIHGGNGFIEEYPVARAYRDARINRIFEGTSEINRMAVVDALMKNVMKGKVGLLGKLGTLSKTAENYILEPETLEERVAAVKRATLFTIGIAAQTLTMGLAQEQQLLMELADMLIAAYALESAALRLAGAVEDEKNNARNYALWSVAMLVSERSARRIADGIDTVFMALGNEDIVKARRLLGRSKPWESPVHLRKTIGAYVVECGKYPF